MNLIRFRIADRNELQRKIKADAGPVQIPIPIDQRRQVRELICTLPYRESTKMWPKSWSHVIDTLFLS